MSEKKMVRRSVAIALGIICIVLVVVGLVGAVTYVMPMINDKDNTISLQKLELLQLHTTNANLGIEVIQLQAWLDGNETLLNQTETWLDDNITYYNSQIANLQNQIANLQNQLSHFTGPILGFFDMTVEDNRTTPETPYLHVNGTVNNFGIEQSGTLSFLYVAAYQNNGAKAIETMKSLDNISGQSSINVDFNFYYNGSALTSWRVGVGTLIVI
jgi:hypothetical protein